MKPVVHRFFRAPNLWWIIKPPSVLDQAVMEQFLSTMHTVVLPDKTVTQRPISLMELAIREIALTFGGTNIPGIHLGGSSTIPQIEAVLNNQAFISNLKSVPLIINPNDPKRREVSGSI